MLYSKSVYANGTQACDEGEKRLICSVRSLGLNGITGYEVQVECDISNGLPGFDVVGLPDAAVREARERVRAAVKNCGAKFPVSRITVNLAPAALKKEGCNSIHTPMMRAPMLSTRT